MYEQITFEIEDPVATITFNRPEKLNPITSRMRREVRHAIAVAERSPEVVGIIITGAGRAFSAGADMGELQVIEATGVIASGDTADDLPAAYPGDPSLGEDFEEGLSYLMGVRKPIIAAINGACAGFGFSLASFCDLRFASNRALIIPAFSSLGLVAEHGTSWILPRLIGPARTLDLLWTGERLGPDEAFRIGLVDRVFEHDQLLEKTKAYVRCLAETASPSSLQQMKQMIYRHMMLPLGEAMHDTNRLMDISVAAPDFKEGINAFLNKRTPAFPRVTVDD